MTTLQQQAYAKLNLTLDILGRREDGYHDLRSVMQQVSLCDDIEIDVETGEDWKLEADREDIPTDSTNLAWKAAGAFYKALGKDPQGITIRITKRIPSQAGLGGGSADAAAVLHGLNDHEGRPFTKAELADIGAKIGSDVPFCVMGGTALVEGRGERVEALPAMPDCFYCIVMPDFSVSTAALYKAFDEKGAEYRPDTEGMLGALNAGELLHAAGYVGNAMEALVGADHPEIKEIKDAMLDSGALGAAMTGSGSAVYGIFDSFDMAAISSMTLMERGYRTYLSRNV